jgi:hypothetical protein
MLLSLCASPKDAQPPTPDVFSRTQNIEVRDSFFSWGHTASFSPIGYARKRICVLSPG